jgi:hypothetical protein
VSGPITGASARRPSIDGLLASADLKGGAQTLAITHIFSRRINVLVAFPQGQSFCAKPFEGFHLE